MTTPFEGKLRFISATAASTGAALTYVNLRPDQGKAWKVLFAAGYQDDGAVGHYWYATDPDLVNEQMSAAAATGANYRLPLLASEDNGVQNFIEPPVITYNRYFRYAFLASAAAKNGYVKAVVVEYSGVNPNM